MVSIKLNMYFLTYIIHNIELVLFSDKVNKIN